MAKVYIRIKSRPHLITPDELRNMQSGVTSVRELANSLIEIKATDELPDAAKFNKVITSRIYDLLELSLRLGATYEG